MIYILYYVLINLIIGLLVVTSKGGKEATEECIDKIIEEGEGKVSRRAAMNALTFILIVGALPMAAASIAMRNK